MANAELVVRVGEMRDRGLTPKAIARTLGLRPSDVSELVRVHASSRVVAGEAKVVGSWMNAGWSGGLSWQGRDDWRDEDDTDTGAFGLVSVLVAREHRYGNVTACAYLVDTHCLGVKDTIGPRMMDTVDLNIFRQQFFASHAAPPIAVPFDLAQEIVLGAVAYAKGLGLAPAAGFDACRKHLGEWKGPGTIQFGCAGKPTFVNGPRDDVASILRTLEASVGRGNFDFVRLG